MNIKKRSRIGLGHLRMLTLRMNGEGGQGGSNGGGQGEGGQGGGQGEGGQGGGQGADSIQRLIDLAVNEATKGLKAKNEELLGKLRDTSGALKQWEGLDPQRVRTVLDTFDKNDELRLIAEGKHDEVINKRIEREQAKWKSQLDEVSTKAQTLEQKLQESNDRIRDLMIDTSVVSAFLAEGGLPSAKDDVVLRATVFFDVEDGQVVARDSNGELVRGKDGPITIAEWVAGLKQAAPHLFPGSQGAGAQGRGRGGSDIDAQMAAAASTGDMREYRRLRELKNKK